MALENGDRELLIRIEERVKSLAFQMSALDARLGNDFVTKESCSLKQMQHDQSSGMFKLESISKIVVLLSVAGTLIFAVLKHG